jgi:hypothetical protein
MCCRKWMIGCAISCLAMPAMANAANSGVTFCFIGLNLRDGGPETSSADNSAAQVASDGVATARDQLHRANIQLERQFEQSADYQQARLAAMQALSAYEQARQASLATVQSSSESASAELDIEHLEKQLDDARREAKLAGRDQSPKIEAIALELLEKRSAISHRQTKAFAGDDNLNNLRFTWIDAHAKLAAMESQFAQQLRADPQWRNAKSQLEQAQTSLASISQ